MTCSKVENPKWQCPICGDIRYVTIESEKVATGGRQSKHYMCRGCSIMFKKPHLFNVSNIKIDSEIFSLALKEQDNESFVSGK